MTVLTGDHVTVETFEQFHDYFDVSKDELIDILTDGLDTAGKETLLESIPKNSDEIDTVPDDLTAVPETTLATICLEYLGTAEAIDLILERRDRTYVFLPGQLAHDIVEIAY